MLDCIGQNVLPGDLVVVKVPYCNDLAIARVIKLNSASITVCYLSRYILSLDIPVEEKQLLIDTLLASDFDQYKSVTLHQGGGAAWDYFYYNNKISRGPETFVKISRDQVSGLIEKILSGD